jgi:hypothetical protein
MSIIRFLSRLSKLHELEGAQQSKMDYAASEQTLGSSNAKAAGDACYGGKP